MKLPDAGGRCDGSVMTVVIVAFPLFCRLSCKLVDRRLDVGPNRWCASPVIADGGCESCGYGPGAPLRGRAGGEGHGRCDSIIAENVSQPRSP